MASSVSKAKRARRYLEASMAAGATGLPREQRAAYESQLREEERKYPGVRRHAIAGTRRHFDRPLSASEREHQRHLRAEERLSMGDVERIGRELDADGSRSSSSSREERRAGPRAAAAGIERARGGGSTFWYFAGVALLLSLVYLLVNERGAGPGVFAPIIAALVGAARAFIAPVDPIKRAEAALGAAPVGATARGVTGSAHVEVGPSRPSSSSSGFLGGLFPRGTRYSVSRTDAGKDFAGISGPIGALASGTIAAVRHYSGFGTTIFQRLDTPIEGKQYIYYALESGARPARVRGRVARGAPIAAGTGGVIEVGLSSSADVSGIEQSATAPEHRTPSGEAFTRALGLPVG